MIFHTKDDTNYCAICLILFFINISIFRSYTQFVFNDIILLGTLNIIFFEFYANICMCMRSKLLGVWSSRCSAWMAMPFYNYTLLSVQ